MPQERFCRQPAWGDRSHVSPSFAHRGKRIAAVASPAADLTLAWLWVCGREDGHQMSVGL